MTNDKLEIKKGIPVPDRYGYGTLIVSTMSQMKLGDCVDLSGDLNRGNLYSYATRLQMKMRVKKMNERGKTFYRMWRVA